MQVKMQKALATLVTGALIFGSVGVAAAQTVPSSVYGIRKALEVVSEQGKKAIEEKVLQQNPGLSKSEVAFKVQDEINQRPEVRQKTTETLQRSGVTDVSADHWASKELAVLVEVGFIQPNAGGKLNPDEGTSVDDTSALFAKVLGIADATDTVEEAAKKAEQSGLVKNRTDIQRDMTRIEVAYMLLIALDIQPKYGVSVVDVPFKDFYLMSEDDWAVVTALHEAGIFRGYEDKTFRPNNVLTKAQIAILVDRVLGALGQ